MYVTYSGTRNLITAHTPVELLPGGDLASSSGWTLGTGWVIAAGVATKTAGVASDLERDIVVTESLTYDDVYTLLSVTAGDLTQKISDTLGIARSTNATFSESIIAGAGATLRYKASADSTFAGAIDNISIMLGTNNWDLEFSAVNAPRNPNTNKIPVESMDGTTQTVVINSDVMTYSVTTQLVTYGSATWLQFMEFFNSVREGESFTFDWRGTVASPDNPQTVKLVGTYSEQYQEADLYRFNFTVKVQ